MKTLHEIKQEQRGAQGAKGNTITNGDYVLRDKSKENGKNTFKSGAQLLVADEPKETPKKVTAKKAD